MVSSFTTNKGFDKPANGDYVDTWNIPVNADWDIADRAFGGTLSVALTNVNVTLTKTNCQNVRILLTGALSGNIIIYFPAAVAGFFVVTDATTGAYTITLASAGGPGLAVNTIQGTNCFIFTDGVNVFYGDDSRGSVVAGTGITVTGVGTQTVSLTTPVAVSNGGTGVSSFTAGNLIVGNGTSALQVIAPGTAGNVLTSTGSAWQSAPPSGTGGGITSISFQTATQMGLAFTVNGGAATVTTSGQTVVLDGVLSITKGGTGTNAALSSVGFVKSNATSLFTQSSINLAADVGSSVLPIANGGTNNAYTGTGNFVRADSPTGLTGTWGFAAITATGNITATGTVSGSTVSATTSLTAPSLTLTGTTIGFNNSPSTQYIVASGGTMGFYLSGNLFSADTTNFSPSRSLLVIGSGSTTTNLSGAWIVYSDARTKKDINSYAKGMSAIASLNPVSYKYNGEFGVPNDNNERVGLIAQDVLQSQLPELVYTTPYTNPDTGEVTEVYQLNPGPLVYTLINAIKELDARVKALEAKAAGG